MNLQNLLDQFMGLGSRGTGASPAGMSGIGDTLGKLAGNVPGGMAGGAAAGGIMALLMSNKSARKFAGKAATYGGAALLGGLAFKAYRSWQEGNGARAAVHADTQPSALSEERDFTGDEVLTPDFQLTLIKAMIAAAKADGHIDATEQRAIFMGVEQMELSPQMRGLVFDLLARPIAVNELVAGLNTVEQKSEVYLASCLVIDPDDPSEQAHLDQLSRALQLPDGLAEQLQRQARMD
ncbi:MAG: DUF533 domain-containing protein [Gammaproteobacteria bacterium]|jgi:uncharacterized membrane protein YebE (DUF533 family)